MLVQVLIERLRAGLETTSVFGAAELYHARENAGYRQSPTWFVVPGNETAQTYEDDEPFLVTQSIQVIVMRDLKENDPRGEAAIYEVRNDRAQLFKQVLGWVPTHGFEPTRYQTGAIVAQVDSRIFYGYTFLFPEQIDPACEGIGVGQLEWDEEKLSPAKYKARPIGL